MMSHSFQENLFDKIKVHISQGSLCRNALADCKLCVPLCSLSVTQTSVTRPSLFCA